MGSTRRATRRHWLSRALILSQICAALSWLAWSAGAASAQDGVASSPMDTAGGGYAVDLLWTVIAAMFVFFMQAGFALVEGGFTRAKNVANILMKNLSDLALGSLTYWAIGFGLMFGASNGFCGTSHFFVGASSAPPATYAFLFFQTAFCATAATIVSGAMAERTRFIAYLLFSLVVTGFIYPVFGSWAWGGLFAGSGVLESPPGGLLARLGLPRFVDFAGSTVVHSVGGWLALAGTLALGPRLGKFASSGRVQPIWGHNLAMATLGVFIMWIGWFGFNGGSTTGVTSGGADVFSGAGKAFALIVVNTNLSACAGLLAAMLLSMATVGKPDVGLTLNGALAGLVAITAGCATCTPVMAVATGGVAGLLVVRSVRLFDALQVDDPVGAISVHGVCGAWGTLAAALFHVDGCRWGQLLTQLLGITVAFVWAFGTGYLVFRALDAWLGLRVCEQDELDGLDLAEHGAEAYPSEAPLPRDGTAQEGRSASAGREYTGFLSEESEDLRV